MDIATEQRRRSFGIWLRTGRRPRLEDQPEVKFNPWHDPKDGRFTFSESGRYYGPGGATAQDNGGAPRIIKFGGYAEDPRLPPISTKEEADAWRAGELAKYGHDPDRRRAIEEQYQRYLQDLKSPPDDLLRKATEFVGGVAEGVYDVGKEVITGLYSLATTNPATSAQNIGVGLARMVDDAIEAEDTPAYVQVDNARRAIANASAREIGHALGSVAGNAGVAVAPGAIGAKFSGLNRIGKTGAATAAKMSPKIVWVDENVGLKGLAKEYNDSAMGARSNVATRRGQAPALERTMPDKTTRLVKFDGVDGDHLIDRKRSIVTTRKGKEQALRQSEALSQNGLTAIWEVPNQTEMNIATRMLKNLHISNIKVRVIER